MLQTLPLRESGQHRTHYAHLVSYKNIEILSKLLAGRLTIFLPIGLSKIFQVYSHVHEN